MDRIDRLTELPEDTTQFALWGSGLAEVAVRRLDDRRYVGVMPFMYTHAVIWGYIADELGYEDRWCYDGPMKALLAAATWNGQGEPEGWHRHPSTGRRRPGGDPHQEYINL